MIRFLLSVMCLLCCLCSHSQPKKPTIIILPSDNWCVQRYFTTTFDNQGDSETFPNYLQAFQEDTELGQVISKIGSVLTEMGYSLKDAEQELKSIKVKQAEDNMMVSKTNGASLSETPLDILKRKVKSDVVIQIWWKLNRENAGQSASFTLEAFDAYTNKRIATSTGTTQPSSAPIAVLLEQAVRENAKLFDKQMDNWYAEQKKSGREIRLNIRCWDNWDKDLEAEYNGMELTDCIQKWLQQNCVKGTFNLSDGTETFAQFEQVRIPLLDQQGRAVDARTFANNLRKYLQQTPYNITSKVIMRGLGEVTIVLGEK